nr:protein ANKUB1 isoform X6 [Phascolarctos cinereus]XP_020836564.1 protein ANKUB1 isoform X6 [Phascolarctos cinereus]XP_020836565.1 protein ANKUB1 isoform X6 [Phascolarctos cinereus]
MAAFYGYIELTEWSLQQGARPNEAVGVHPYREWCHETYHPDTTKCPIHAAAETGQLLVLKAFINYNVLCLDCKNAVGQIPLTIALKHKHKDCVLYLVAKMWSMVSYSKISIPMRIYIKIKQWLLRAQHHILQRRRHDGTQVFRTRVGDFVMVDGFTQPKMTSKEWSKAGNKGIKSKVSRLPSFCEKTQSRKTSDPVTVPWQQKSVGSIKLPPIKRNEFSRLQECYSSNQKKKMATSRKKKVMTTNLYSAQVPLPSLATRGYSHPPFYYVTPKAARFLTSSLESFLEHSGKTARENAIYCLATARYFSSLTIHVGQYLKLCILGKKLSSSSSSSSSSSLSSSSSASVAPTLRHLSQLSFSFMSHVWDRDHLLKNENKDLDTLKVERNLLLSHEKGYPLSLHFRPGEYIWYRNQGLFIYTLTRVPPP